MSEKEREILAKLAKLPPAMQDRFLDRLQGAADALDTMAPLIEAAKDTRQEA